MPGGMLAHKYGGKWPLGLGLFFAGLATVLTPVAARTHKYLLCLARVVCGLGEVQFFLLIISSDLNTDKNCYLHSSVCFPQDTFHVHLRTVELYASFRNNL
jgi:hypothetical protein